MNFMHIARVLNVDSHGPLREGRRQERPLMKAAEHLMPADESRPAEGEGPGAFF